MGDTEAVPVCDGFQKVLHERGGLGLRDGTSNHAVENRVRMVEKRFKDLGILARDERVSEM